MTALLAAPLGLAGCGQGEHDGHGHDNDHAHDHEDGHDHENESSSGAEFVAGKGVRLADDTRKILGIEVAELSQQQLPRQIRFNVQVFGEKHHHAALTNDHAGCDVYASGFLPLEQAAMLRTGLPAQILQGTNESFAGVVLGVEKAFALGESEVIIGLTNAMAKLKPGEFLPAVATVPREGPVLAMPRSALLRTAEGTFAYVVEGEFFNRTPVGVGSETDDFLEITNGLAAGASVVNRQLETLYLIELRATKGGGHSH